MINTDKEWGWMDSTDYDGMGDFSRTTANRDSIKYRQGRSLRQVEDTEKIITWVLTGGIISLVIGSILYLVLT